MSRAFVIKTGPTRSRPPPNFALSCHGDGRSRKFTSMDPKGGPDASGLSDCCTEISDLKLKQEKCCSETRTNNLGLESDLEDLEDPVLCTRHMQRRLSCEEVENVLEKLRQLMATPLDLPENDGKVLDCHLLKELSPLDADKMIDDTFNKLEDWLKHQRQALKRHLSSHRFVVSTGMFLCCKLHALS